MVAINLAAPSPSAAQRPAKSAIARTPTSRKKQKGPVSHTGVQVSRRYPGGVSTEDVWTPLRPFPSSPFYANVARISPRYNMHLVGCLPRVQSHCIKPPSL